jgi:ABC-type maltose transport system permease subunit
VIFPGGFLDYIFHGMFLKGNNARVALKVWIWHHVGGQIATRQDLGFAAAYADGDFTCVDEENGLLDFFQV